MIPAQRPAQKPGAESHPLQPALNWPILINWPVRRLIVNSDDFGLTHGVNRAVVELHAAGVLTSATLMARAPATDDAIALALETPSLGMGCHVVLVDGQPVLNPSRIPSLIDEETGNFHLRLGSFLRCLLTGSIKPAEIEREAAAQIALLKERGVRLAHIDTHKHTHMFPAVLRPLLRAARAAGIRAVRNPFEPAWSRRATRHAPLARRMEVALLHSLAPAFRRIVTEEGFITTSGSLGVLATGTLDAAALTSLLHAMPQGTWELVTHPGYNDNDLAVANTRLKASREAERQALLAIAQKSDIQLISFAQFCEATDRIHADSIIK
jgi:hopanoid biosynthesis associated protein HpnK